MNLITSKEISKDTFFIVYDSIVKEYNLTPTDILVYSIVRSYCEYNGNEGYYGSVRTIADRINVGINTARRSLHRLVDIGLLKNTEVEGECSVYQCLNIEHISKENVKNEEDTPTKMVGEVYQNGMSTPTKMTDNNKIYNNKYILKDNYKGCLSKDKHIDSSPNDDYINSVLPRMVDDACGILEYNYYYDDVLDSIKYFFNKFKSTFGISHPRYRQTLLNECIYKMISNIESDGYEFGFDTMQPIIDKFFAQNISDCDYHLRVFVEDNMIRIKTTEAHCMYDNEVFSEVLYS